LEVFEEDLTRRELLGTLFDHCCCRCRHGGVASAGASSCAPLKLGFRGRLVRLGADELRDEIRMSDGAFSRRTKQGTTNSYDIIITCTSGPFSLVSQVGAFLDPSTTTPHSKRAWNKGSITATNHDLHSACVSGRWMKDERKKCLSEIDMSSRDS
jgi:hypothetical protein